MKIDDIKLTYLLKKNNIPYKRSKLNPLFIIIDKFDNENVINELINDGYIYIQNISSGLVVDYLNPNKKDVILDACSSPGGKGSYINQLTKNMSALTCLDINENRLNLIRENFDKLGINNVKYISENALTYKSKNKFSKILIDVPCSSSGTLRKNPDIKWKLKEKDIKKFSELQYNILNNLSNYLANKGELVYSTCSILREENEKVILRFLDKHLNFSIKECDNTKLKKYVNNIGGISIFPYKNNQEGMFAVKIIKND